MADVDVLIPYPGNQPEVQPEVPVHPFESALIVGNRDRILDIWKSQHPYHNGGNDGINTWNESWILRNILKDEKCTLCKSKFTPARHIPCSKCSLCSKCHTTTNTKEVDLANTIASYQRVLQQNKQKYESEMRLQRERHMRQISQNQYQIRQLKQTQVKEQPIKGIPKNFKTTEANDETKACKICMTNEANCLIIPCCHKVACSDCIKHLTSKKCPVCRTPFTQVAPIYEA